MCKNTLAALEFDAPTQKRAAYEVFEFALEAPDIVRIIKRSYGADKDAHSYTE